MTAEEINRIALSSLENQKWIEAQTLLFENARKNPSYQTYNNLGYFLIVEGLTCKNGAVRNAYKLGMKYLLKSAKAKSTAVNLCAITTAIDYAIRTTEIEKRKSLYEQSYNCVSEALKLEYSNELQYNYLRILYILHSKDHNILAGVRNLVKQFICNESVSLYLEVLRIHSLKDEGLRCIKEYGRFLDVNELLIFYTDFAMYEEGYALCDSVYQMFDVDKVLAAAIIECCVNTGHYDEARDYAQALIGVTHDTCIDEKKDLFSNFDRATVYRRELISKYRLTPAFMEFCCYFGCKMHGTAW